MLERLFPDRMTDDDIRSLLARGVPGDTLARLPIPVLGRSVAWLRPLGHLLSAALVLAACALLPGRGPILWVAALPLLVTGLSLAHRLPDLRTRAPSEAEKSARFARATAIRAALS